MNRGVNRRPSSSFMKLEPTSLRGTDETPKSPLPRPDRLASTSSNNAERSAEYGGATIRKERSYGTSMASSASLSQVSGVFSNLKQSSTGAADRLGKAGKGFLGKITRSGSTTDRELLVDDIYVCSVINRPLKEQSRRTRIAKHLDDCRDKTEFWMPALPYRCVE